MVIGAYYPELSGGGLPCREIVTRLSDRARFIVLTTTADPSLPEDDERDGVPVYRVRVEPSLWSKMRATFRMASTFWRTRRQFDIVHLHGFSQKSVLMVVLARLCGKRLMITLTSVGHDDPVSMKQRGALTYWAYARAEVFAAVSPRFRAIYETTSLPPSRFRFVPNSVDVDRFSPVDALRRREIRGELGLPLDGPLALFVGFFSREKGPDRAFDAFARISDAVPDAHLLFIGATRPTYYEIDPALSDEIRHAAAQRGLDRRVHFVESTLEIHRYFQAADVYLLTSTREGLPVALIEAMSCGLACIATRLEGITDVLITDGITGTLIAPGDVDGFARALRPLLVDAEARRAMGARAREVIALGFSVDGMVHSYDSIYQTLAGGIAHGHR